MNFKDYYHETPSPTLQRIFKKYDNADHKTAVWNAFIESNLTDVTDDDFSILPRLLPESYLPTIKKNAKEVTTFALKLLSLSPTEIRAIVPRGPIRDFLIDELEILKYQPKRMTGSFRFDMAVVGPPDADHPIQVLEINEIGFDGLARSTFFQKVLMHLIPEMKNRVISLDTAAAEVRNMRRLGPQIARVQYDCYNWDEEYLLQTAERMGSQVHLVSPAQFHCKIDKEFPLLRKELIKVQNGKVRIGKNLRPDALNMSFAFSLSDYKKGRELYSQLIRSQTPQYGPFITGLVASKTILILLNDPLLRRKLLGNTNALKGIALPAYSLEDRQDLAREQSDELVLKHADGFGGQQVFMDQELVKWVKKISPSRRHEWVLQQKTRLNSIDVNGILSRPKRAISDLGVFVQYDWENGKFRHFEVGGLMSRATNRGLKVNVSSGGLQAAVMIERGV